MSVEINLKIVLFVLYTMYAHVFNFDNLKLNMLVCIYILLLISFFTSYKIILGIISFQIKLFKFANRF